ncbi:Prp18-domain-containing protein [Conidiobolus coronatus NRRL 28638]|uniref:Pre-mRNA-splicing factor 18 n=1 Tax=Conidiobolus coronatus (strain ATCC 28846 / CBS 209.66 / NRRL 28638) TaxID=796925 RepID=A0A137PCU4_CONC2|nr:Prp18-domain-containing protein [Conidiobolus coronatus NRRL 28638]|eukprot:KXN72810.1 Prp18-domain-containing protein [Conidiobolus coronatus NRRL 28638]
MDFLDDVLKSEISKKKAELKKTSNSEEKGSKIKYVKRSELERIREEEYLKDQEKLEASRKAKLEALKASTSSKDTDEEGANGSNSDNLLSESDIAIPSLPEEEVIRRLRAKGQPIRLFAETDRSRQIRLRALELIEERSEGQRNDFMQALSAMDTGLNLETLKREHYENNEPEEGEEDHHVTKKKKDYTFKEVDTTQISTELMSSNIDRLYSLIYVFFKRTIKEWESDMHNRPEEIKRSTAGINAAATQHQTAQYLKPFFRNLKNKDLPQDVLIRIIEICNFVQEREYMKANDSYLKLSIGNAAWPIGVTMVGIHERSAREKISAGSVAHVLNDESQRKWIQSIKRIMTYLQRKYPPSDFSKLVG